MWAPWIKKFDLTISEEDIKKFNKREKEKKIKKFYREVRNSNNFL